MINTSDFGGFLLSKNVKAGKKVAYVLREKSSLPNMNGWTIYSEADDEEYISNPKNFEIVSATTIEKYFPALLEIFPAKYGTDLALLYQEGVFVGFYDLVNDEETTIDKILEI